MRVPELCVQRKVSRAREYSRSFILPLAIISLGKWKSVNSIGTNSWEQRGYSIISVLSTTHLFVKISINHVWKSVMCLLNFMILSAKWTKKGEKVLRALRLIVRRGKSEWRYVSGSSYARGVAKEIGFALSFNFTTRFSTQRRRAF